MAYRAYGKYGTVPAASNPVVPANPIHEVPDAYRPDFMPLHDTRNLDTWASDVVQWEDYAPQGPYHLDAWGASVAEFGTVTRQRDNQERTDRPVDDNPYPSHFLDPFDGPAGPDLQTLNLETEYDYDDLDRPGGFIVDRRGSDITPAERAWQPGRNWLPGANSLEANNAVYDRWRHDQLVAITDFGEPIQHGTDIIVTVDRKMIQGQAGNLAEGMLQYPHPAGDNILQAPMAPSQFPDRAMEIADPYLPGDGGLAGRGRYRDTSRHVYVDPATGVTTQAFAEEMPAGAVSYDLAWE